MPDSSPALLSMAQEFQGLPMSALIGGPLNAAAQANSSMAMTQVQFLLNTCFENKNEDPADGNTITPIMINMTLTRGVINKDSDGKVQITPVETSFKLPLLTVVPLNSLAVETADVTFEMQVKSSFSQKTNDTTSSTTKAGATISGGASFLGGLIHVSVSGNLSYDKTDTSTHSTHYQKSNSAKYTVSVHAGQLPLPKGVNTIIEAFTNSIQPIEMPTDSNNGNNNGGNNNGGNNNGGNNNGGNNNGGNNNGGNNNGG